jgi:outer membrane lipoprotein-sorting protein
MMRRNLITALAVCGFGISAFAAQTASQTPTQTAPPPAAKTTSKSKPKAPAKTKAKPKADASTPTATALPSAPAAKVEEKKPATENGGLEAVLDQLDKASADFKSTEADFVWDQYQKVVDETDTQKGKVYFVRHEKDTHMAANVNEPDKKDLVFTDGKLKFYQPRIDQLTEYDAGKNKTEVETFLVLGFGGRGHDLLKSFDVKLAGFETIEGVRTAKLELDPKSPKVKNTFAQIILWLDPARGVSLKQQFIEPSGDYRIAKYSNFKMNGKVGEEVFKLKTTPRTKVVKQQ